MSSEHRKYWVGSEEVVWTGVENILDEADDVKLEPLDPETEKARHTIRERPQPDLTVVKVSEQPARFQFTLRHVLMANVIIAVAFALVRVFAPSGMAGLFGIAVFISGIVLAVYQPEHPMVTRIWWGLVAMYVVFCAFALLVS